MENTYEDQRSRNQEEIRLHGHVLSPAERKNKADVQVHRELGGFLMGGPGQKLLEHLEEQVQYHGDLHGPTVEKTYFNLGAREVVRYLRQLRDNARKDQ